MDTDVLKHMLGMYKTDKHDHGFRNYFCSELSGDDHAALLRLEAAGLVERGRTINKETNLMWHATEAGVLSVGLDPKKVFER